jgi:hypothetical protein
MLLISERAGNFTGAARAEVVRRWPQFADKNIGIVITSGIDERKASWHIGPEGDGLNAIATDFVDTAAPLLVGEVATWQAILAGHANMAVELHAGRLRWVGEIDRSRFGSAETRLIADILNLKNQTFSEATVTAVS